MLAFLINISARLKQSNQSSLLPIADEPHKFATQNKTWANIKKFNSQYIFRYGATFNEQYKNLIYQLTSVESFNQNLVKGMVVYVEEINEILHDKETLLSLDSPRRFIFSK